MINIFAPYLTKPKYAPLRIDNIIALLKPNAAIAFEWLAVVKAAKRDFVWYAPWKRLAGVGISPVFAFAVSFAEVGFLNLHTQ